MTRLSMTSDSVHGPSRKRRVFLDRFRLPRGAVGVIPSLGVALLAACGGGERSEAAPAMVPESVSARGAPIDPVLPRQLDAMPARAGAVVATIAVRRDTTTFGVGPAIVTLTSGDTLVVTDSAVRVWALGGSMVAVSGLDGAGGFENEGQSLTVIDVATGTRRRVISDYFPIVRVERAPSPGRSPLLVHMRDGGRGSLHVTVVDPRRGQVFRASNALGRIAGDRIIVSGYADGESAVEFGDRRRPLRVDTIPLVATDTLSLLVLPRAPR